MAKVNTATKATATATAPAATAPAAKASAPTNGGTVATVAASAQWAQLTGPSTLEGYTGQTLYQPKRLGKCMAVWQACTALAAEGQPLPTPAQVQAYLLAQPGGATTNITNTQIETYAWRKWHGFTGRGGVYTPATA